MKIVQALLLTLLGAAALEAQQYTISTIAGGAPPPTPIVGVQAAIGLPHGVAVDSAGNVYFSGLNCVFKLDANGVMTRVAGTSRAGYSGDGGPAASAQLNDPHGLAVDGGGNLYIADQRNNRIRKVSPSGIITTVAGSGSFGYSGDGGPATSAQLGQPKGVAVDAAGSLYIADYDNNRIRKVSAAGMITTVAGGESFDLGDGGPATSALVQDPSAVAVDASGNLYITDPLNHRIRKVSAAGIITTFAGTGHQGYSGDGGPATSAEFFTPWGLAVDAGGSLYIADIGYSTVRKVSAAGIITTVAGHGSAGLGDGGPATSARLSGPSGVAVDRGGNLYIADASNLRIRKVSVTGIINTVAGNTSPGYSGDGGPAASAQLIGPMGVAADAGGNLYIADYYNNRIQKVSAAGIITTVAGNGFPGYSGDGGPATQAQLDGSTGVALDADENLYIADNYNGRIRRVSAAGIISTVAGNGSWGYSGDGGPATSAQLWNPHGVAVDASGNLYIADYYNNRIRKVSAAGIITTVAGGGYFGDSGYSGDGGPATEAQLDSPAGVALDADGNLYIADSYNDRIRKVSAAGIITTVAGNGGTGYFGDFGPATDATLWLPTSVAVDAGGNLYIADQVNNCVRKVSAAGIITTVAGNGSTGYSGDGGPAAGAQLWYPSGVALDASGGVYVADFGNSAVRLLTPSSSACNYTLSSTSLQFPVAGGSSTLTITTGTGCAWAVTSLPYWITVSGSASGSGSGTVTLVVAPNSGPPRSAQISAAGVTVMVQQASNVLSISSGGVVNAASYTAPVAPGSIAAIFGNFLLETPASTSSFPIPTSLNGLSLEFFGAPLAPLFYASMGQVNAQVPWELARWSGVEITASLNGQTSVPQLVNLATYAPGIFAMNGAGTGQGAILDANYLLVDSTNPATAGSTVVQIYCTGLGPVSNQPATGAPAPGPPLAETTSQPTVTIGGAAAPVHFSGLTPGSVGLYQVNALVPQGSTKGSAVPVVISIGGVQSNTVTIAVR